MTYMLLICALDDASQHHRKRGNELELVVVVGNVMSNQHGYDELYYIIRDFIGSSRLVQTP